MPEASGGHRDAVPGRALGMDLRHVWRIPAEVLKARIKGGARMALAQNESVALASKLVIHRLEDVGYDRERRE